MKNLTANVGDVRDAAFDPWVRQIPCRRAWPPSPIFLPGEAHGQRRLVGYGPSGCTELNTTEATQHTHTHNKPLPKQRWKLVIMMWKN